MVVLNTPNALNCVYNVHCKSFCFCEGHILSDWMSIRHYCLTQLKTVWLHMGMNYLCDDEERSFFIMRSMYTLFMVWLLFT